ncbi:entericidin A/B family lipoprotein [Rhodobacter sp. NTK016B]|nr:entericidin A/B family lipoprotein [Rhodobacter sp. NTK016B]MBN8290740.1 entericidin A/B family lipoprotein [Rhodobacter sp. NTK016B]
MKPLIPLLIVAAALLSACETVQGAGRDLQSAGHAVSSGAQQVQNDL